MGGTCSGRSTRRGCGSNVTTNERCAVDRERATSDCKILRCPTCSPSKFPTERTVRPSAPNRATHSSGEWSMTSDIRGEPQNEGRHRPEPHEEIPLPSNGRLFPNVVVHAQC